MDGKSDVGTEEGRMGGWKRKGNELERSWSEMLKKTASCFGPYAVGM